MGMKLEIFEDDRTREVDLPETGTVSIGRLSTSDIIVNGTAVSRRHAALTCSQGGLMLEDAGSKVGTCVNGAYIDRPHRLKAGDVVQIGSVRLVVKEVAPAPSKAGEDDFAADDKYFRVLYGKEMIELLCKIQNEILARVNAGGKFEDLLKDGELARRAEECLDDVLMQFMHELPLDRVPLEKFRQAVRDELLDLGPISQLIRDPRVTEVMVNSVTVKNADGKLERQNRIFVESHGLLHETAAHFRDEAHLIQIIERIVQPLGRQINQASPMVDARLSDGSRVNAVIPPLALDGSSLTIRKFADRKLTTKDLEEYGSLTPDMALFLEEAVKRRQNILVSGGTGSGKTTLLNILSQFIPDGNDKGERGERVVTIEDSAELKLSHRNIVRLEARPANIQGAGRVTIRDLVINALRMRPDRIIVGECRGAEALDMLQAMNTGHDGSLTTAHANSPRDALARLENMVMMAGYELPSSAIREQIASAIDIIVHEARMADGSRKIVKIVEVSACQGNVIQTLDIFEFKQTGFSPDGRVEGYYTATGNIPYFIEELRQSGQLTLDMKIFVPQA